MLSSPSGADARGLVRYAKLLHESRVMNVGSRFAVPEILERAIARVMFVFVHEHERAIPTSHSLPHSLEAIPRNKNNSDLQTVAKAVLTPDGMWQYVPCIARTATTTPTWVSSTTSRSSTGTGTTTRIRSTARRRAGCDWLDRRPKQHLGRLC